MEDLLRSAVAKFVLKYADTAFDSAKIAPTSNRHLEPLEAEILGF